MGTDLCSFIFKRRAVPADGVERRVGVLFQVCVKGLVGWEGGMYGKLFNYPYISFVFQKNLKVYKYPKVFW